MPAPAHPKIHVAKPEPFDGTNWEGFKQQVTIFLTAADHDFPNDLSKVLFVLSYLDKDTMLTDTWAQRWEQDHTFRGSLRLDTNETFN